MIISTRSVWGKTMPKIPFSLDSRFAPAARSGRATEPAKSKIWKQRANVIRSALQPTLVLSTMAAMAYLVYQIARNSGFI
jgi:hypothetical protein